MKTFLLTGVFFCSFLSAAFAQIQVSVDVSKRLKTLTGRESGVNIDYLMDGGFTSPATSTSGSLKRMGVKLVRYPGGEKSDNYLWSAAPWSKAAPRMALLDTVNAWPTEDSRFVDKASAEKLCKPIVLDFDELMTVCAEAGTEPLIVVAYDAIYNSVVTAKPTKAQLLTNAVEWVRYANVTKKFGIKYWMIGNESWNHPDYNGQATAEQYAADLLDFAKAMKAVDPTIKIIANGQNAWWETLLKSPAVAYIDLLAYSVYPVDNFTNGYEDYRTGNQVLVGETEDAIRAINKYAPDADRARIKVLAAEFNSIDFSGGWSNDNNLGHALCNFQMFGDMVVNPKLESALLWNTRWTTNQTEEQHIFDALDKAGNLNAIGVAQQVWSNSLLNTLVTTTSNNPFIKAYASYDTATQALNLILLNKDTTQHTAQLSIGNYLKAYNASKYVFTGTSVNDKFPTFTASGTLPDSASLASISLAPASVTVLKITRTVPHPDEPGEPETFSFAAAIVPNPVASQLNLQIESDTTQQATVRIIDALGRICTKEQLNLQTGKATYKLRNLQRLQRGVYWLQLVAGTQHKTLSFFKE